MDKFNIVSSQAVLEMSSFSVDTRSMSSSPLVNSLVKNRLFKTTPDIDELLFQFIHTIDLSLVDTMLVTAQISSSIGLRSGLFGGHRLGTRKFGVSWRSSSTVARAWRSVPVHCPAGTQSRYHETLYVSLAAVWRHYDVVKQYRRSQWDITRISCFVTTKLLHALHIYSTVFVWEVYAVAFFKAAQQQTIREVGNSIVCLWADNFCLQQWKNY